MLKKIISILAFTSLSFGEVKIAINNKYLMCTNIRLIADKTEYDEKYILLSYACANRNNEENKTIVGLVSHIVLKDVFGKKLYDIEDNVVKTIKHIDKAVSIVSWVKDNPFLDGELYDKLYPSVSNKSIKTELTISKILYKDGTFIDINKSN